MKVRCPVCNGCGGVEPSFGNGGTVNGGTSAISAKICPGCGGTGMQETDKEIIEAWKKDEMHKFLSYIPTESLIMEICRRNEAYKIPRNESFGFLNSHGDTPVRSYGEGLYARLDSIETMVDALKRDINRIDSRLGKPHREECACKPVKEPVRKPYRQGC